MKLRIKGDSVRLRLTQDEVSALARNGLVEEQVHFGEAAALVYRLRTDVQAGELTARFDGATIEVRIPEEIARRWCASDTVSLSAVQRSNGAELSVLVEKDLEC